MATNTSYLRAALERSVEHVQSQEEDEDMEEDIEETDDFQLSFQ